MNILQHIFVLILPLIAISCNSQMTNEPDESLTAYYKIEIPEKHTDILTESTIEIFNGNDINAPIIKQHLDPNQKQIVDI